MDKFNLGDTVEFNRDRYTVVCGVIIEFFHSYIDNAPMLRIKINDNHVTICSLLKVSQSNRSPGYYDRNNKPKNLPIDGEITITSYKG